MDSEFSRILTLPQEVLQWILSSIANFEPWTYNTALNDADVSITDADLSPYIRDAEKALNYTSSTRRILGLSNENEWLLSTLSRHPNHLSSTVTGGIPSAVSQALRRMNAQLERNYWATRESHSVWDVSRGVLGIRPRSIDRDHDQHTRAFGDSDTPVSTKQYHAVLQSEEEACGEEAPAMGSTRIRREPCNWKLSTALVAYAPTPLLKLSAADIMQSQHQQTVSRAVLQLTAAHIVVIAAFTQCRQALMLALEKLESDSPLPSIEQHEGSQPNTSARPDRLRSMSGSTVAEPYTQEQELSLSVVSTVYDSSIVKEGARKELRWAEKRESEEKDTGKEIKRPKLSDYKQVSSGRVATLMDRFEKFHI